MQVAARLEVVPFERGVSYAHCDICQTDFSVASGGLNEVKHHIENKKHKEFNAGMASQSTLASVITRSLAPDQVARAVFVATCLSWLLIIFQSYAKLCSLTVKLLVSIHLVEQKQLLLLSMLLHSQVVEWCCSPYTILCDGGNDQFGKKYFAIMVHFCSDTARQPDS